MKRIRNVWLLTGIKRRPFYTGYCSTLRYNCLFLCWLTVPATWPYITSPSLLRSVFESWIGYYCTADRAVTITTSKAYRFTPVFILAYSPVLIYSIGPVSRSARPVLIVLQSDVEMTFGHQAPSKIRCKTSQFVKLQRTVIKNHSQITWTRSSNVMLYSTLIFTLGQFTNF